MSLAALAWGGFSMAAHAACDADETLVGEDDRYWYCGKLAGPSDVRGVFKLIGERIGDGPRGMLADEWRFRKRVLESAAELLRANYPTYYGGKLVFESGGARRSICVGSECAGFRGDGVDCSGFVEFAAHSACIASGFFEATAGFPLPRGSAADQAEYFRRHEAFIPSWGFPDTGDLVFFKDTTGRPTGRITHVALFIGKTPAGRKMIMHTSYDPRHRKVMFMEMPRNYEQKVVGFGNVSKLFVMSR